MTDDQPLTCVRCWHAPASRLLVVRWREETMRLLCTDCAAKDEADAPGLPSFRSLTVLIVWPERGAETEWGVRYALPPGAPAEARVDRAADRETAERMMTGAPYREKHADDTLVRHEVGPWKEAP